MIYYSTLCILEQQWFSKTEYNLFPSQNLNKKEYIDIAMYKMFSKQKLSKLIHGNVTDLKTEVHGKQVNFKTRHLFNFTT